MIRFAWLQFRMQATVALAALFAFAVVLVLTGRHLASLYARAITGCHGGSCANAASTFLSRLADTSTYPVVYLLGIGLILAAPAIIGIFWGAPLIARELEAGTYRLAWTQSIARTRWLVVKLALTGLAAMTVTEALSLMQAWWADPIGKARDLAANVPGLPHPFTGGRLSSWIFATHGITPLGYAAFGFALGTQSAPSPAVPCPPWPSPWPSSPPPRSPCRCGSARTSSRLIAPSSAARRSSSLRG
jgi:hypothetical protein